MRCLLSLAVMTSVLSGCAASEDSAQPQDPTAGAPATAVASTTAEPSTTSTPSSGPDCSAEGLPAEPQAQPDLPEAVQETRREIYRAAVRCDFDRLEELAGAEGFTYSFGGGDDPAGFWRRAELQEGEDPPMRYLAGLLQRPYGARQVQGTTSYSWPSAFVYDTWADVPARDRDALKPLYDDEDFAGFEQFGAYVGYRLVVAPDGTWRAFVAGD